MSDAVSALNGAGWSKGIAKIAEAPLQGMITLRGDLTSKPIKKAVAAVTKVDMPGPGQANGSGDKGLCWMSPDELLVLCPYDTVAANIEKMNTIFAKAKAHALAVDVSDARAVFRVSGPLARDVMAKLAPVDVSPAAFQPGMFRRTRMAQVATAFWMPNDDTFQIVCFRSQGQYMFDLLKVAAQPGSALNIF